jgi:hypothetical protein
MRVQTLLFYAVDGHLEVCAADAAFIHGLGFICHAGNPEGIQSLEHIIGLGMKFQERCGKHVAGSSHIAFKIKCFHRPS